MPDTGAPWNIPYVAATDLVSAWPTANQTMAEAIADGLDQVSVIKQVVNVVKTDPFSLTSATYTDVTGLTVSITPTQASNKVLALFTIQGVGSIGGTVGFWRAMRDSTAIGVGTDVGSRVAASGGFDVGANNQGIYSGSLTILDSPATTSEVTYKVQIRNQGSSTVYVNRTQGDSDSANSVRSVSSITLMEVEA